MAQDRGSRLNRQQLAGIIRTRKKEILEEWMKHLLRSDSSKSRHSGPRLADAIPLFLEQLALVLENPFLSSDVTVELAKLHGHERAKLQEFSIEDIFIEYSVLRSLLLETFYKEGTPEEDGIVLVNTAIDESISGSALEFMREIQEESQHLIQEGFDRIEMVAEMTNEIIWATDYTGKIEYVSPQWRKFTGTELPPGDSAFWERYMHPEDLMRSKRDWEEAFNKRAGFEAEYRLRDHSGKYVWFSVRAKPIDEGAGGKTRWLGVTVSIQRQKELQEMQRLALEEERNRSLSLLYQAPAVIFVLEGPQHRYRLVNKYFLPFVDSQDVIGKPIHEALPRIFNGEIFEVLDEVYRKKKPYFGREIPMKMNGLRGSRDQHYYNIVLQPWLDEFSESQGILGMALDVTEDMELRSKLRISEERLHLATRQAHVGIWDFDPIRGVYEISDEGRKLLEIPLDQDVSLPSIESMLDPENARRAEQEKIRAFDPCGDGKYKVELKFNLKSGKKIWVNSVGRAIFAGYGLERRPIRFIGTFIDVSELKQREEQIKQSEEQLRIAIQAANMGTWDLNVSDKTITWSPRALELVGIDPAVKFDIDALNEWVHPEDRDKVRSALQKAIDPEKSTGLFNVDHRIIHKDGKVVWVSAMGRAFFGFQNGEKILSRFSGTLLDITERMELQERLQKAKEEAEAANTAKSAFLANMSHEIRTPLGAIMGFVDLMKDSDLARDEIENYVGIIERNSNQLLRIIDDILDLSKVEAGKMTIEEIDFSLKELLADFSSLMGFRARENGIDFLMNSDSPVPERVISDPVRIRQILTNIVGNAIKFTRHGHVELKVNFNNPYLTFTVEDTGRGISAEQASKLFQPFTQADSSTTRQFGGTGLGLALTRRLSEFMHGAFWLERSELGKGSTFVTRVQVGLPENAKILAQNEVTFTSRVRFVQQKPLPNLSGMKVLVVEDSPDNQKLMQIYLRKFGIEIDLASDGVAAMELASANFYDVIFMDVQMPRMDGHEATEILRSRGYKRPIIALTAHAMKEERERCLRSGFTDFLSKPIHRESLAAILRSHFLAGSPDAPLEP